MYTDPKRPPKKKVTSGYPMSRINHKNPRAQKILRDVREPMEYYTGTCFTSFTAIVIKRSTEEFTRSIIIMILISIGASVSAGLRGGIFLNVIQRMNIRVRKALFLSLSNQEIGFYDETKTGNYRANACT